MEFVDGPVASCDICGGTLSEEERTDAALTLLGGMCPTPMSMHQACYEKAQPLLGTPSDTLLCEAPIDTERDREIERQLDEAGWVLPL